jgi:hypothetical protein
LDRCQADFEKGVDTINVLEAHMQNFEGGRDEELVFFPGSSDPGSSDQGAATDHQLKKMISRNVLVPDGENLVVINA